MKLIKIDPQNPEKEKIKEAIAVLENGGTVVYPTDTLYGLGANIFREDAVRKVYAIKKRSLNNPISVCVSEIGDINKIAYLDRDAEKIIKKILPGPYTIILRKKEVISPILTGGGEKIGIRIPENRICRDLTQRFPVTTTSANISGKKAPKSLEEVLEELSGLVDIILDDGISREGVPSTVVDLTVRPPRILRKGAKLPL
jgi:L-threonylcarbamoyladenylate synthase